jgi:hypothetical protein
MLYIYIYVHNNIFVYVYKYIYIYINVLICTHVYNYPISRKALFKSAWEASAPATKDTTAKGVSIMMNLINFIKIFLISKNKLRMALGRFVILKQATAKTVAKQITPKKLSVPKAVTIFDGTI